MRCEFVANTNSNTFPVIMMTKLPYSIVVVFNRRAMKMLTKLLEERREGAGIRGREADWTPGRQSVSSLDPG